MTVDPERPGDGGGGRCGAGDHGERIGRRHRPGWTSRWWRLPPAVVGIGRPRRSSIPGSPRPSLTYAAFRVNLNVRSRLWIRGVPRFVGSHPVAGRERSGPHHASADLFAQRPWIVCPTSSRPAPRSTPSVTSRWRAALRSPDAGGGARRAAGPALARSAAAGIRTCGRPGRAWIAARSRSPAPVFATPHGWPTATPRYGRRSSPPTPQPVAAALARRARRRSTTLVAALESADAGRSAAVRAPADGLGRQGRDLLAGKHGQAAVRWATVAVVVPDEPGALARLLVDAADAQVNVEDIRVDHSPGQPLGLVELDVAPDSRRVP